MVHTNNKHGIHTGSIILHKFTITAFSFEILWAYTSSSPNACNLSLTVLVATIDAQWEGMGDVGSVRYEPALLPPCPTMRVLSYSN